MTQLTGDSSHVPEPWLKLQFSHDLQIVANIWDIVSTQVNKIYNTGLVVFGYFTAKFLHIAPLKLQWTKDSLKNAIWNRWCHKLACNQSRQHVIINEWISELVWVSGGGANLHIHRTAYTKWGKGVESSALWAAALCVRCLLCLNDLKTHSNVKLSW